MNKSNYDVVIIGAGVAGLTAAEEAARLSLRVCLIEELMFGGLVVNVNELLPALPGFPASGIDLATELMTRASDLGVSSAFATVTGLQTGNSLAVVTTTETYDARSIIIASGAHLRKLGVPGEDKFQDRGVSHCADCDAPLYQGQDVVVVGGGDAALQEALVLSAYCAKVHLIHRGASFRAREDLVARMRAHSNIQTRMETSVEELRGGEALASVALRGADGASAELPCTGFFAYVGLEPNTAFLPEQVATETDGRIRVNDAFESALANVYAIGAVRAGYSGHLTHAMSDARGAVQSIAARLGPARSSI